MAGLILFMQRGRMKLKIYLFRHAQTYYNRAHRFTGWKDSKLTPFGRKQAKKIALLLKGKKIDMAFQSHLSRSKETLKEVLKFHPECRRVLTDDRIIERSYGKLQGMSHNSYLKLKEREHCDVIRHWHNVDHLSRQEHQKATNLCRQDLHTIRRSYTTVPPDGESIMMVEKRVYNFIKDLLQLMRKEKVNAAISAHGNSMRPFRRYFEKLSVKEMMELENPWDDYFEYTIEVNE